MIPKVFNTRWEREFHVADVFLRILLLLQRSDALSGGVRVFSYEAGIHRKTSLCCFTYPGVELFSRRELTIAGLNA